MTNTAVLYTSNLYIRNYRNTNILTCLDDTPAIRELFASEASTNSLDLDDSHATVINLSFFYKLLFGIWDRLSTRLHVDRSKTFSARIKRERLFLLRDLMRLNIFSTTFVYSFFLVLVPAFSIFLSYPQYIFHCPP